MFSTDTYESESDDGEHEKLEEHREDGYYPVFIGQLIDQRYLILKKLGWGAFSTVWLAHDLHQNKFVALKVQKSGENYHSAAEDEIEILDLISEKWENEEWKSFLEKVSKKQGGGHSSCHCLQIMGHFELMGLKGAQHTVMVLEIMGVDLFQVMKWYDYEGIPLPIVRTISRQILIALHYLHSFCNAIHTDIKPENVLLVP